MFYFKKSWVSEIIWQKWIHYVHTVPLLLYYNGYFYGTDLATGLSVRKEIESRTEYDAWINILTDHIQKKRREIKRIQKNCYQTKFNSSLGTGETINDNQVPKSPICNSIETRISVRKY